MPLIAQGKTNWKYILIVFILAAISAGVILVWQWWPALKAPESNIPVGAGENETLKKSSITILSPNGGESLFLGKSYEIKWEEKGVDEGKIKLVNTKYGVKDVLSSEFLTGKIDLSERNFIWRIPLGFFNRYSWWNPGDCFKISITEFEPDGENGIKDSSDECFVIDEDKILEERKQKMIGQMFPSVEIRKADYNSKLSELWADEIIEGEFLKSGEKSYLMIARASGSNPEGYDHAYLGIFDKNDKLQTPVISRIEVPINHRISLNPPYFGGDGVSFNFYDCKDIKYIFVSVKECLTGGATTCEDSSNLLLKVKNNQFVTVQDFLKEIQLKETSAYAAEEGIRLYHYVEKDSLPSDFQCVDQEKCLGVAVAGYKELPLVFLKEIPFNYSICKF